MEANTQSGNLPANPFEWVWYTVVWSFSEPSDFVIVLKRSASNFWSWTSKCVYHLLANKFVTVIVVKLRNGFSNRSMWEWRYGRWRNWFNDIQMDRAGWVISWEDDCWWFGVLSDFGGLVRSTPVPYLSSNERSLACIKSYVPLKRVRSWISRNASVLDSLPRAALVEVDDL